MQKIVSNETMRKADAACIASGTDSKELMMRAAKGVFDSVKWEDPILIVCGTGNNAGDGYALSLLLKEAGYHPSLLLSEEKWSKDGEYYFLQAKAAGVPYSLIDDNTSFETGILVDCIFGTGFHDIPKSRYRDIIERINDTTSYIVSVDINSGLNGDTGMGESVVKSNLTVAIGCYKYGHYINDAAKYMERKTVVDIGIPVTEETPMLATMDEFADYVNGIKKPYIDGLREGKLTNVLLAPELLTEVSDYDEIEAREKLVPLLHDLSLVVDPSGERFYVYNDDSCLIVAYEGQIVITEDIEEPKGEN